MSEMYDSDYFLRGKQTGKSLYKDYRWLPNLTIPMVRAIINHLGIKDEHTILDFGCARGYVVKAFREMGHIAVGIDISEWAVTNCDPDVREYIYCRDTKCEDHVSGMFDWIIAKDVLEHVHRLQTAITNLLEHARIGVFAVVPLSCVDGNPYVVPDYEHDITHRHRLTLATWASMFIRPGWRVEASYRVRGVKDNYAKWECGNGFLTARRMEE